MIFASRRRIGNNYFNGIVGHSVCYHCLYLYCSIETITLGDKRIGIKTSVLEEKATACNMLCCYADELKEGFFPWIDQVNFNLHYVGSFSRL